jgi:NAD(P)-dependent dehydrogenase (short-subunit alcohol dehydrogenase family)
MIALVTGATRGIGRALAAELARRGHTVYGGGRSWPEAPEPTPFHRLALDVTDDASCKDAVARVLADHGRLDLLVNNAGIGHCGAIEDTPLDYARQVFETNYFGVTRLAREALPIMRRQGGGTVAIVGSAAGRIGIPFQGHYAASKFALEGLAEALFHELQPFNIRVLLLEPGDVGTTIWQRREQFEPEGSVYAPALHRFLAVKEREMGAKAAPPERVAAEIADVLLSRTRRLRHPVAPGARLILLARKLLPDAVFLPIVGRNYRLR